VAELIDIAAADGTTEAYLAQPAGSPQGGVLFFMDAIGLRPRLAEMVDRIASWGYVVLAPNVFYRWVTSAQLAPDIDLRVPENRAAFFAKVPVMQYVGQLTPELSARDDEAYVAELDRYVGSDAKLGSTGYCMGARLATRVAAEFPDRFVAVGGFHGGGLVTDAPNSPHLVVTGTAEYLYLHADNDPSASPERVAELGRALADAGATYTNEICAGAMHGYTMSDTAAWHEEATERHFRELKALFERRIG
jgi:carboxymethylenebutenolidase